MLIDLVKCIITQYCGENIQKKKRVDYIVQKIKGAASFLMTHTYIHK